jgi:hypothetical protein
MRGRLDDALSGVSDKEIKGNGIGSNGQSMIVEH